MARAGRRRKGQPPPYLRHAVGAYVYAYVRVGGKRINLGEYGSPESRRRYGEIVRAWEQEADEAHRARLGPARAGCSILEIVAAHALHAKQHYRGPDGEPTSEVRSFVLSLDPLLGQEFAAMLADSFRPGDLKKIRDSWIKQGLARRTINQHVGRIKRLFRWAASEELVSVETAGALGMVRDLARGRTPAPDHAAVEPVPLRDLALTLRHVAPVVGAMIRTQYYCGARPGEVCRMTSDEIDQGGVVRVGKRRVQLPGGVWVFQPSRFKQLHTGKVVAYILGARAQEVMTPYIGATSGVAGATRNVAPPIFPSPKKLGSPWSVSGYQHAIADACTAAGAAHWSPGQLRHSFLQKIDRLAGIQAASIMVSHANISTTEIYVERNLHQAAEIAAKHG